MVNRISVEMFRLTDKWSTPCFDKLTDVGWTDAFALSYRGVKVGVRVNDTDLIPLLRARMPKGGKPVHGQECDVIFSILRASDTAGPSEKNYHLVYHNHSRLSRSLDFDEVLRQFDSWLLIAIGFLSDEGVFLHAGVVAWRDRGIVIPGRSHSGKSTLVSELVRAGAQYVSDEVAVLHPDGSVGTIPKALSLRSGHGKLNAEVSLSDLGGQERDASVVPGLVLVTRYHDGARWEPRRAGQGETVLALLDNAHAATRVPETVAAACENLARTVPAYKSQRGEASVTAKAVLAEMDRVIDSSAAA